MKTSTPSSRYESKKCRSCDFDFQPTSGRQWFCVNCGSQADSRYPVREEIPEGFTQVCSKCEQEKSADQYGRRKGQNKYWLSTVCLDCHAKKQENWRATADPQHLQHLYRKSVHRHQGRRLDSILRKVHNIRLDDYLYLLEIQNGVCATCGRLNELANGRIRRFEVDHDHACCSGRGSCGKCIRGLLCSRCNSLLGKAQDDLHLLESLVDYLSSGQVRPSGATPRNKENYV